MSTEKEQVIFRLRAFCRFDSDVEAFVGYLPRLQVYAQAATEDELKSALQATALRFILACADKKTLGAILHDRAGCKEVRSADEAAVIKNDSTEFISVKGYKERADPIEVSVPLWMLKFGAL
jgi:hypothetical protein